jgi:nucleoside phosphorylase
MAWTSQLTKQLTHDDYTVAWICALPIEKTAARNMLDELHRAPPQPENDNNIYTLGSVCGHNVVIVCQGDMGTTAATMVATQMVATFRKLRFGLLVGIAGGVPDVEDIRLGDVVVSKGGVVAHDLGKETPSGFELRPFLNGVPELLKNAFSELESLLMDRESNITRYISNAIARNPRFSAYERPTPLVDNLFDKEYIHLNPGDKTCSECDKSQLIRQGARHSPKLHFGIVASGNQVIKNGIKRGKIAEAHPGVMAIEMEAAGLMNVFGCATIRGICDYADSHKNDGWHKYASAVAAAAAKEILSIILPPIRAATPAISMNG